MALSKADLEAVAALIATTVGSPAIDAPIVDAKAETEKKAKRVTVPTFDVKLENGHRLHVEQEYTANATWVRFYELRADGSKRGPAKRMSPEAFRAIRNLADAKADQLVTDQRA